MDGESSAVKPNNVYVHINMWNLWAIVVYTVILTERVDTALYGVYVLCLRWWKGGVYKGMFCCFEENYEIFTGSWEGGGLGVGWSYGRIRESRKIGGKYGQ